MSNMKYIEINCQYNFEDQIKKFRNEFNKIKKG